MPIKSGIGFGEAQVYSQPGALVNTYGRLLQKQAQDNAKFQNELADLISKVKTEGSRDIDKPLIAKAYDDVKNLYRQAASVRNPSERNLIRSQISSGIQSLNEVAARSAEESKLYKDTLGRVATTGQFLYDPNKLNDFKLRINKPITELTAFNPLDLERIPDDSIRDKAFDNMYTELKNKSVYQTRNIGGGKEQEVGVVNPTLVTANIIERIGKSPEWLNLATRNYVQANPGKEPKLEDIIDNEVKLYMVRRGNEYVGTPTRIPRATGSGDDASNPANYEVLRGKTFVTEELKQDGKVTPSKPVITFDTFVTTPVGQPFATPQIGNAFNITYGKSEPIRSKKGLRITGMGVKNSNLRVTVVDDDEVEYYLKPQDIPLSIRNGKQYKAAERALGGSSAPAPAPAPSTKPFDVEAYLREKKLKK
jgi:hypothetical protein